METKGLIMAFLISYIATTIVGPILIPFMIKLKVGQNIREEGPKSHMKKQGTPTMGGIIFLVGILAAFIFQKNFEIKSIFVICSILGFGAIGFVDDYLKVVLKRNLGLRAYQKIIGQLIIAVGIATYGKIIFGSELFVPFVNKYYDFGSYYIPIVIFVLIAVTNSVNLTDGLDGLAGTVTVGVVLFFGIAAISSNLEGISKLIFALIGGLVGFLMYNKHPAKIFMGDVGSLALGGAVGAIAISTGMVFLIPIVGFIYFIEAFSVIIQVISFKTTGKRVFKMSPLHHHFELSGWDEVKIVAVFNTITLAMVAVGYLMIY